MSSEQKLSGELQSAAEEVNSFSSGSRHSQDPTPLPGSAAQFQTSFSGQGAAWNPFAEQVAAVATAQNFGIIGTGKVVVLSWRGSQLTELAALETKDGVFDCAWNEEIDSQLAFGLGDGSVTLWDYKESSDAAKVSASKGKVLQSFQPHGAEVYSLSWSQGNDKSTFVTGSWDHTLRLYTPVRRAPIRTFQGHTDCVYMVSTHPGRTGQIASVGADASLRIWDSTDSRAVLSIPRAHPAEILSVDWNKYDEYKLATGSVDRTIQVWDIRQPKEAVDKVSGHQFAVRNLKWSPHNPRALASCGYDMTVKIWDLHEKKEDSNALIASYEQHTEFVIGLDWNMFRENVILSAGWDEQVYVWSVKNIDRRIGKR